MCQDVGRGDRPDGYSQSGCVLMMAEKEILEGKFVKASFVEWASRRIKRVVRSSLAAEVHGLSMGLDSATWAR
eukprot:3462445-Alexandrium_andersonii.AAC.1